METYEGFPDYEQRLIDLALREQDASQSLWWLTEHGYYAVVTRICEEALAALPKTIT